MLNARFATAIAGFVLSFFLITIVFFAHTPEDLRVILGDEFYQYFIPLFNPALAGLLIYLGKNKYNNLNSVVIALAWIFYVIWAILGLPFISGSGSGAESIFAWVAFMWFILNGFVIFPLLVLLIASLAVIVGVKKVLFSKPEIS